MNLDNLNLDHWWPGYIGGVLTCAIVTVVLAAFSWTGAPSQPKPEVSEYEP